MFRQLIKKSRNLHRRHITKSISWRLLGSIDTFIISSLISNDTSVGLKISLIELVSKLILYYLHERVWYKFSKLDPLRRHIIKTFTWRFIGSTDTIIISFIVTGDFLSGMKIGIIEIFSKMIFYFLHERVWYRINFGLDKHRKFIKKYL